MYQQGRENTCVYSSLASAFAYFGDHKLAATIHKERFIKAGKQAATSAEIFNLLNRIVNHASTRYEMIKTSTYYKGKNVSDDAKYFVHAGQVMGTDYGTQHFVSYCNGWIFDSTLVHAIPKTDESLDWCCGGYDADTRKKRIKFDKFTKRHYIFVPVKYAPFMRLPKMQKYYHKGK